MKYKFQAQIVNRILRVVLAVDNGLWGTRDRRATRCVCVCACVLDPFATWEVHKNELLSSYRFVKDARGMSTGAPGDLGAMLWKVT